MALISVAVFITFSVGSDACAAEKSAKLIPARIAVVSRSTLDLPFWVAREQGFFRDEGIDAAVRIVMAMSERPSFDLEAAGKFAQDAKTIICITGEKETISCRKYLAH